MKNDNVISMPNDTVVILSTVVRDALGNLVINPLEVAFGKFDENDSRFYCIDNSQYYESLEDNLYNLEEGKLYYCFDKTLDELRDKYGDDLTTNRLACLYMGDILETFNVALKENNDYSIHSIPLSVLKKKSDDPISSILESEEIKVPMIITHNEHSTEKVSEHREKINPLKTRIDMDDFEKFLKERVIDNDDTIESIATIIAMNLSAEDPKDVQNILSIGPTGCGKSATFKCVSEYLDLPVVMCDSTQLSAPGYVGKDVEDFLKDIYFKSGKNINIANRAIFILDEIDKLAASTLDMKEAAQDTLLKVIEGQEYTVELDKYGSTVQMNTLGMTIVGCGAFSKIFDERIKEAQKNTIGFNNGSDVKISADDPRLLEKVTDKELKEYGFKSEFIPRFHTRYVYKSMDENMLRKILTESKDSALLAKQRRYLKQFNTDLKWDDSFIDAVVARAVELKSGGRSLNATIDEALLRCDNALYRLGDAKKKVLKISGDTVTNPRKYDLK